MPQSLTALTPAKPGYKHTRLGCIPEDWEVKFLGESIDLISGQHLGPDSYNNLADGIPYFTGPSDFTNDAKNLTKWTNQNTKFAETRDVLVTVKGSGVGQLHFLHLNQNVAIGRQLMAVRGIRTDNSFLFYALSRLSEKLEVLSRGNMIPGISRQDILKLRVPLPPLPEQQKIAEILTTWDEAITNTEALITAKRQLKKGLMQQLLTGKKRFAEFVKSTKTKSTKLGDVPEDWEVLNLREIVKEALLGGNYENAQSNVGIPLVKMGNLGRGAFNLNKIEYIPISLEYERRHVLGKGDLLFNTRNTLELVGKVSLWREELSFALFNSNLLRLKFDSRLESSNEFVNYCFNCNSGLRQLRSFAIGTTSVAAIYTRDLMRFKMLVPSINEQQRISSVLSAADAEIESLQQQLSQLKAQKKGLMQRLLTGQVRVNLS